MVEIVKFSALIITFTIIMGFSFSAFIYKNVIDRILSGVQASIIERLNSDDNVLDVACGTGSLSISMSEVAQKVTGLDLSEEMVDLARRTAHKKGATNVKFSPQDASDLSLFADNSFDIAVTSMAVHQFDAALAIEILQEMKRIAGKVIIMDYNYQMPAGFSRLVIYIIEWIAGGDHYRNFRNFNALGGLDYFISASGLTICEELYKSSSFRVAICE